MFNKIIKEYDLHFALVILNLVVGTYWTATGLGGKKSIKLLPQIIFISYICI